MPDTRIANAARLEFAPGSLVRSNLSGIAFSGDWLWMLPTKPVAWTVCAGSAPWGARSLRFGEVRDFPLATGAHFGPRMAILGNDNAFDIEGLAVDGRRLLLGLRGPVLGGWSALLEIQVEARGDQRRLVPLDDSGSLLRRHFLHLDGLGVRDLHFCSDDRVGLVAARAWHQPSRGDLRAAARAAGTRAQLVRLV